ncbi:MAG: hypothetical protein GF401_12545 [Chitinivibrionales bacterium]|nr:hypothetical protein [Chitinivibrionales bacterium]
MKWSKAIYAGVLGGLVMTIILAIVRAIDIPVNLSMLLGTLFGLEPSVGTWIVGFIVHLVISGLIALGYGWAFEHAVHHAGTWTGAALSGIHIILGGLLLGVIPALHPMVPGTMNAPGIFMSNLGTVGVVAFIVLHVIYGMIVGGLYGEVLHKAPAAGRAPEAHAPAR